MGSRDIIVPARPTRRDFGMGTRGRQQQIYVNWFMMKVETGQLYHYDVSITKETPPPREDQSEAGGSSSFRGRGRAPRERPLTPEVCRIALAQLAQDLGWDPHSWAYDGRSNMYAISDRLGMEKKVEVATEGDRRPSHYKIVLKVVGELNDAGRTLLEFLRLASDPTIMPPQQYIQALDIVLRHPKAMLASTDDAIMTLGPAILFNDRFKFSLGGNIDAWRGYRQSIRLCQDGIALNIDSSVTPMWYTPTREGDERKLNVLMREALGNRRGPDVNRILNAKFKGLKIKTEHTGYKKVIKGFTAPPHIHEFEDAKDGKRKTVAQYFHDTYGIRLTDNEMPCISIGKAAIPPEVCFLVPKQRCSNIDNRQQATLVSTAPMAPAVLKDFLHHHVGGIAKDCHDMRETFKLNVDDRMAKLDARELPEVRLEYNRNEPMTGLGRGEWNMRGVKFFNPSRITSFGILSFVSDRDFNVYEFVERQFIPSLRNCGIETPRQLPPVVFGNPRDAERAFDDVKRAALREYDGARPELILTILPDKGVQLYKAVKKTGDSLFGIITQCVVVQNLRRNNLNMYLSNVAMKINAKLSGINVKISAESLEQLPSFLRNFEQDPYIVMGFDVNHPQQGSPGPSIAAVVGSMDKHLGVFSSRLMRQVHKKGKDVQEVILDVTQMVIDVLEDFAKRNRFYPERFIIYRDGVSDGQFAQVVDHEYKAVRSACREISPDYKPTITFVVVQKKHQTRFFPTREENAGDKKGNVKPGTVVDSGITSSSDCDFFLSSHAGLLGTNRPAHYHVLVDENGFTADELQLFTYWTTFTFARCTRSISIPPAARYAHLAAARGRLLLEGERRGRGGDEDPFVPLHENVLGSMFFI